MKIKLLAGLVANKQPHSKGDEIEVSDRDGQTLILNGKAIKLLALKKPELEAIQKPKRTRKKPIKEVI